MSLTSKFSVEGFFCNRVLKISSTFSLLCQIQSPTSVGSFLLFRTTISILSYQRAWQTFKRSHTFQIFKNDSFFIDEQMILLPFFDNSNQKSKILEKPNFFLRFTPPDERFCAWWSKIFRLVG